MSSDESDSDDEKPIKKTTTKRENTKEQMSLEIFPIKDDPTKPIYREVGNPLLKPPFTYAFVGQ